MKRILIVLFALAVLGAVVAGAVYFMRGGAPESAPPSAGKPAGPEIEYYTCSMHPNIRRDKPGNCPACGMELQPVYKKTAGHDAHAPSAGSVTVSVEEERLLGIRTVAVKRGQPRSEVKTVGRVEVNEEKLEHIHTRYEGWVEELYVNAVGQTIRRGDPLFTIYSPQLVSTQEEYLLALRARKELGAGADPTARMGASALLDAARERMRLWEIPDEAVRELERTRKVERLVTLRSHASGYVQDRNVTAGQRIMPGTSLYVIADLHDVWLTADVYERDIAAVRHGAHVTATFASAPGRVFEGTVSFIYPFLDETTRTNKIRIMLANPDLALKPGMFGEIAIHSEEADSALVVPADAVMITGERNIVFVQRSPGIYEPVEVKLGEASDGSYVILEGLKEGDIVVERGNFFLDSESQLRMTGAAGAGHQGHAKPKGDGTDAKSSREPQEAAPSRGDGVEMPPEAPASEPASQPSSSGRKGHVH